MQIINCFGNHIYTGYEVNKGIILNKITIIAARYNIQKDGLKVEEGTGSGIYCEDDYRTKRMQSLKLYKTYQCGRYSIVWSCPGCYSNVIKDYFKSKVQREMNGTADGTFQ